MGHCWEEPTEVLDLPDDLSSICPECSITGEIPPPPTESAPGAHMLEILLGAAPNDRTPVSPVSGSEPSASPPTEVQPVIPGYEILGELGRGGMGVVYKARHRGLKRLVALKVLRETEHTGKDQLQRFRAEAEAAARLQHPNIVQIHEVGEENSRPYIVLELAVGGSLEKRLAGTPLPPRAAAQLVRILAQAMDYAHKRGVIHRDLKPSNVLLQAAEGATDDSNKPLSLADFQTTIPKISDFSLAKQLGTDSHQTHTGVILGTPSYMAPEQAKGQAGAAGPAVDIYALGAILYEVITGRPPFRAATLLETLEQVRSEEPVPPKRIQPGLPRDLQTICLKCLEKSPRQRYETAADLAADLERFLDNTPIRARPAGPGERLVKWARRRPTLAALAVVSGMAVIAASVGILIHNNQLREQVRQTEMKEIQARKEQARADANYRDASATLNQMLARLQQMGLADVPRLRELQQQLLEDALAFYQRAFQQLDDPDPAVRLDVATAYQKTATIQNLLGRQELASENFHRAIDLLGSLPEDIRNRAENRGRLADCCLGLGDSIKPREDAEQWLKKAIDLREQISRSQPQDADLQFAVAITHHHLGSLYQVAARLQLSEAEHNQAVALLDRLTREHPSNETYQAQLADSCINLAGIYQGTERPPRAAEYYKKASEILEVFVKKNPSELRYQTSLAALCLNWGNLRYVGIDAPVSLDRYTRAIEICNAVLRQEPRHSFARYVLLNASGARSLLYNDRQQYAEALADYDRVVELSEGADKDYHEGMRTAFIVRAGDYLKATSMADALSQNPKADNDALYAMARAYSLAIEAAKKDTRRESSERNRLASQFTARSLALLARVKAKGYFNDPGRRAHLQNTADLASVRSSHEFRKLVEQDEAKKK
jgi:serine/threonine-protein kinase